MRAQLLQALLGSDVDVEALDRKVSGVRDSIAFAEKVNAKLETADRVLDTVSFGLTLGGLFPVDPEEIGDDEGEEP